MVSDIFLLATALKTINIGQRCHKTC